MGLEHMRCECKQRFRGAWTGCCAHCGKNIKVDMVRHVSAFHLDLAQLWRCPVAWCTQWKGTPQDCVDHIQQKHMVQDSDDESPVCKSRRAVSPATPRVPSSATSSTIVSSVTSYSRTAESHDLPVTRRRSILYSGRPTILPVSMPLPKFADRDFVPSPVRSALVATQPYPSSPESRASTCVDLDAFASDQ